MNSQKQQKQFEHSISVNERPKHALKLVYTITNTQYSKPVEILLAKDKLCVSTYMSSQKQPDTSLATGRTDLGKGLKIGYLLHILRYDRPIQVDHFVCTTPKGTAQKPEDPENPTIYSMVNKPLLRKLLEEWGTEKNLQFAAECSNPDLTAALNALILSKTKEYETERFIYLWVSMNGLYSFYAKQFKGCNGRNDKRMLNHFAQLYGFGPIMNVNSDNKRIGQINSVILRKTDAAFIEEIRLEGSASSNALQPYLDQSQTVNAYGYYLFKHCYYYRCELFHANHGIKLLSYRDESEIRVLNVLNTLLEEFLDHNLHLWFDPEYREHVVRPAAENEASPRLRVLGE